MTQFIDAKLYLPGTPRTVLAVVVEKDGSEKVMELIHDDDWRYDTGSCEKIMKEVVRWAEIAQ